MPSKILAALLVVGLAVFPSGAALSGQWAGFYSSGASASMQQVTIVQTGNLVNATKTYCPPSVCNVLTGQVTFYFQLNGSTTGQGFGQTCQTGGVRCTWNPIVAEIATDPVPSLTVGGDKWNQARLFPLLAPSSQWPAVDGAARRRAD
eukprot:TRINITY_DN6376_c0_g1_i3.p1 TRINITY_DN6376_c0_g1~~TRINITY_DN6376_c0_g1_i3.p1  ORF type:complete len:148 (-),score=23.68 TRINITY_DN6376_c0_g1_i3:53-496(-)